ncbi:MAG: DNA polymerase III subunit psi [Cytophagales bacterium]|nr:DNA polymerase III subunit psi [Cytophagales bacterium]
MTEVAEILFTEELYALEPQPTIVLTKPWATVTEDELDQLNKILGALKLTLNRVSVIYQPSLNLSAFSVKPKKLIYFGPLPVGLSHYEHLQTQKIDLVASEDLSKLIDDKAAKAKLWEALRKLFSI